MFEILVKNIIDNAFKYSDENWEIKISYKNWKLDISNTWKWISQENIDKIWDVFWKEDVWRTKYYSYGLWLSLVKKILNILSYEISVKSENNITTFSIFIKNND